MKRLINQETKQPTITPEVATAVVKSFDIKRVGDIVYVDILMQNTATSAAYVNVKISGVPTPARAGAFTAYYGTTEKEFTLSKTMRAYSDAAKVLTIKTGDTFTASAFVKFNYWYVVKAGE